MSENGSAKRSIVRVKGDQPRFGLKTGDVLVVEPWQYDPDEKYTVIRRVADGFDPQCNIYRADVEYLGRTRR